MQAILCEQIIDLLYFIDAKTWRISDYVDIWSDRFICLYVYN